jgi:hypothetical protein
MHSHYPPVFFSAHPFRSSVGAFSRTFGPRVSFRSPVPTFNSTFSPRFPFPISNAPFSAAFLVLGFHSDIQGGLFQSHFRFHRRDRGRNRWEEVGVGPGMGGRRAEFAGIAPELVGGDRNRLRSTRNQVGSPSLIRSLRREWGAKRAVPRESDLGPFAPDPGWRCALPRQFPIACARERLPPLPGPRRAGGRSSRYQRCRSQGRSPSPARGWAAPRRGPCGGRGAARERAEGRGIRRPP